MAGSGERSDRRGRHELLRNESDLAVRKVYAEAPPRVEYRLSERGETWKPVIRARAPWGENLLVQPAKRKTLAQRV